MIFIVNAENRAGFGSDLAQMHRQRKAVFVDGIGWDVPVVDDLEIDAYDRDDTVYLISKSGPAGPVRASARLLPTVRPHLMSDLFEPACAGGVPRGPDIWEASRFCPSPLLRRRRERIEMLWEIIAGIMETALLFGINQVTFAANAGLLPLARDCGWRTRVLGPTLPDGKDWITAVIADIDPQGLSRLRQRWGITGPVTRFMSHATALAA